MHPLIGILLVLSILGIAFGLLARWRTHAELRRKALHMLLGLTCISFPWIFDAFWPVLLLCLLSLGALLCIRGRTGNLPAVLHGVGRESWGDLCFPVSVCLLFALAVDPVPDYVLPLLILTLADAVGALVGVRFGRAKYSTDEGFKSLEGSLAFFIVTFACCLPCLLWGTSAGLGKALLISSIIGLLVMLLEGFSRRGFDNLWVPLASYILIQSYVEMPMSALLGRLGLLLGILAFFVLVRRRSYANDSVLLASALVLYLIWAVGGWAWALAPLGLALLYALTCAPERPSERQAHGMEDLAAVSGAGLIWLVLSVRISAIDFDLPFLLSWAAQSGILVASFISWRRPTLALPLLLAIALLLACIVILPSAIALFDGPALGQALLLGALTAALSATCLWKFEWQRTGSTHSRGRPARQLIYGLCLSFAGFLPIFFGS